MDMLKIGICGACGKMGKRIASLALRDPGIEITSALEGAGHPGRGKDLGDVLGAVRMGVEVTDDARKACEAIDCLIDFTLPGPTLEHLAVCAEKKIPVVIGTTGIDRDGELKIKEASSVIPVVFSPNMAVGVNLLFKIIREAAMVLGPDFSVKVDETHHVHKKDSPSGTAKMIARIVKEASGSEPEVEAFREGEVVGNHGVMFDGEFEKLEIRHDAKSRDVFASGALRAAKFLSGKGPGLYSMGDVLGIK